MVNDNELMLIRPEIKHEQEVMQYRSEFYKDNVCHVNGSCGLHHFECYDEWLKKVDLCYENAENKYYETKASTFLAVRKNDNRLIGMIQVRHNLTEELRNDGGNIGYSVRPCERRKGYATRMLNLALDYCRELGLKRVLIDCDESNIASAATILKCGGVFDRVQINIDEDGKEEVMHQYWIYL